ncbi:hypothetical protein JOF29_007918 [Kribbella aluminosa]|uniref:Uncharacterized protein n=1 Tax=Kribbella aluminosa TaxID=416017 RepID=A0ABS4UYS5_9ACTN|nr:hypothetical protein [Kribbella aluminosa]MBP2356808.1 hypothetical protein [Kribbella aluminosa]
MRRIQSTYIVDAEQTRLRFFQDLLSQSLAATFFDRAEALEWARPRTTDFNGRATAAELAERDERLRVDAERCRRHAELLLSSRADAYADDVRQVLAEAS